jgi:hypothetical protein
LGALGRLPWRQQPLETGTDLGCRNDHRNT